MCKTTFIILFVFNSIKARAQHCPWDCSGMIMLKTAVARELAYKLNPVLVDETKKVIIDTMFGTGKPTYDSCNFLHYDDFAKYRTAKIAVHRWYQYDTVYHFAEGMYIVKYNFCKYRDKKIYLRYTDPYTNSMLYHYVEISQNIRIHLHNYSNQLFNNETDEIKTDLKNSLLVMDCENWKLRKEDCKE